MWNCNVIMHIYIKTELLVTNFNPVSWIYNSCDMSPMDDELVVQFQVKTTLLQHILSPRHMICTLVWWQNMLQKKLLFLPTAGKWRERTMKLNQLQQWKLHQQNSQQDKQAMLFFFSLFFLILFLTNKQKINNNQSTSHIYQESQQQRLNILR